MIKRKKDKIDQIAILIEIERWAFRERHGKRDFYKYLERVLKLYWKWKDNRVRKAQAEALAAHKRIKKRNGKTSLHILVEATSKQNVRVRSRWVQGLRFAQRGKNRRIIKADGFKSFWKDYGGIAGCAQELAKPHAAKKKKTSEPIAAKDDDDWDS